MGADSLLPCNLDRGDRFAGVWAHMLAHVHNQSNIASRLGGFHDKSSCSCTVRSGFSPIHYWETGEWRLNSCRCGCGFLLGYNGLHLQCFYIVGLLDRDAMVQRLAMQVNLLANTEANICLGNDESLLLDVHDINPLLVGICSRPLGQPQTRRQAR